MGDEVSKSLTRGFGASLLNGGCERLSGLGDAWCSYTAVARTSSDMINRTESKALQPSEASLFGRFLAKLLSVLRWGNQSPECIFCKIAAGNDPVAEIHYHDSKYVVITDIAPASDHHYLVIPKEHIRDVKSLDDMHIEMVKEMSRIGKQVLESRGGTWENCRHGFHWPPFISVSHLHMHIISPESELSTRMDLTFRPDSYWFKTTDTLLGILDRMRPPVTQIQSPVDDLSDLR